MEKPIAARDLQPPRAGHNKCLRPVLCRLNRLFDRLPESCRQLLVRIFSDRNTIPPRSAAAAVISLLPGLGHLFEGRCAAALAVFTLWILLVFLSASFYAGVTATVMLSLLMSYHASIMIDAGSLLKHTSVIYDRLRAVIPALIIIIAVYLCVDGFVRSSINFIESPINLKAFNISEGDVLIFKPGKLVPDNIARGRLIGVEPGQQRLRESIFDPIHLNIISRGLVLGRVIAQSGETLEISSDGCSVNGLQVSWKDIPEGKYVLPEKRIEFKVPEKKVAVAYPTDQMFGADHGDFIDRRYGNDYNIQYIWKHLYIVGEAEMKGEVIGIYLPIEKRELFSEGGFE